MKALEPGEAYIKKTGTKVLIIDVDRTYRPYRYKIKTNDGNFYYCSREDLCLRKPKLNEKN